MNLHEFGLLVIILLLLLSILILCAICSMKVYKILYGTFESKHDLPTRVGALQRSLNNSSLDPRTIQSRIKFLRKPYKKMKECHSRNLPPIVEVNSPVDSDAKADFDESTERASVSTENGGVSNFWKRDTIIVM